LTVFTNALIFDGVSDRLISGQSVFVAAGRISEVSDRPVTPADGDVVDCGGRTLMPGLIDLHIHAYASNVDAQKVDRAGEPYRSAHAVRMLGHALDCGFTTVRDIGGGDWSLWRAIEDGLVRAPRFFYAGKILSMTGGHGDFRLMSDSQHNHGYCACGAVNSLCVIADGVDECLKAVREELRRGAHCIKIMGSGGVASPTDPIWMNQYREDEIRAMVNECAERRSYVASHCHPAAAVRRSVAFGVRCIEHGTLIDAGTAAFVAEHDAYVVPTMAVIFALVEMGPKLGFPPQSQEKVEFAYRSALEGMVHMRDAGVKLGFGTDLLGETYDQQCREFTIRSEVFKPLEILRQATSISAEILMREGELGCIKPGAHADLLVVDGNPIDDISLLAADGHHLSIIMKAGEFVKQRPITPMGPSF
jgi:imidazolonepropionase-like amidohydrolase